MKNRLLVLLQNKVLLSSGIMFIGTMVVNVGAYLYHVIVGRIMGPEKYGEFAALFSLLFIMSVPANVVQISLTKFFSEIKAKGSLGQAKSLLFITLKYLAIGSLIGSIIFLPIIPFLQRTLHIGEFMSFVWLFGIVASSFYITAGNGILNGYQKFVHSSLFQIINIGTRLITGIIFAPMGAAATLFGMILSNVVSMVYGIFPLRFLLKEKRKMHILPKKEAIDFAFPTLMTTLAITMLYNIDVVLVKMFFTSQEAGIYASLNIFGKIIFFASSALLIVLFPMAAEKKTAGANYKSLVNIGLIGVGGMSLGIAICYMLLSSIIPTLLFGSAFASAGTYLGIYGLFLAFTTTINYLSMMCLAIGKTTVWKILLIGTCLQVAGMYLFHFTLFTLIISNTIVTSLLFIAILIYYAHEDRHS